jgi:outer membrane protein assembly factor BamD (BamD/ComL family)
VLELSLSLDKGVFLESEPLWAEVVLRNKSGAPVSVRSSILTREWGGGFCFELTVENGKRLRRNPGVHEYIPNQPEFRQLDAGDSLSNECDFIGLFSTSGAEGSLPIVPTAYYLSAGSYAVQALQPVGRDTLRSRVVHFQVVRPAGDERAAWTALKLSDSLHRELQFAALAQALEDFLVAHPKSVYSPHVLERLLFVYQLFLNRTAAMLTTLEMFVRKYPNHKAASSALKSYGGFFIEESKSSVLENLARDLSGTRAGRMCERMLVEYARARRYEPRRPARP